MPEHLKALFNKLFTEFLAQCIEKWVQENKAVQLIFSFCVSTGAYMLTEQLLGTILLSVPIIYLMYCYIQNNSIKDKFVIRSSRITQGEEKLPLISEYEYFSDHVIEKNYEKLYLILECENYSNQLIQCFADLEKSFIEIKSINSDSSLSGHKDKLRTIKHQFFPYSTNNLICYRFSLDEVLELAEKDNDKVVVHFKIVLKYGLLNKKCNFETLFTDKADLKISLDKEKNVVIYNYQSKLNLLD